MCNPPDLIGKTVRVKRFTFLSEKQAVFIKNARWIVDGMILVSNDPDPKIVVVTIFGNVIVELGQEEFLAVFCSCNDNNLKDKKITVKLR